MMIANVIIISFKLNNLVCCLLYTVNVEVTVFLRTVKLSGRIEHSTDRIELIIANRKKIVGTCYVIPTGNSSVTTVNVVVIPTFINKTCGNRNAVLKVCGTVVAYKDTVVVGNIIADQNTVGGKLIHLSRVITLYEDGNTFMAIALTVEGISVATDCRPYCVSMGVCCSCTAVEACTVAELCAVFINNPSTLGNTALTEVIIDPVDSNRTDSELVVGVTIAE